MWNDCYDYLIEGVELNKSNHLLDTIPYIQWYIQHTIIRYVSHQQLVCDDEVSSNSYTFNHNFFFHTHLTLIFLIA